MEEQKPSLLELEMDDVAIPSLKETTKWTKFLSVTLIVFIVLMLFCALIASSAIASFIAQMGVYSGGTGTALGASLAGGFIVGVVLVVGAVMGVITYFLYSFSVQVRKAVDFKDQPALEKGIASLKNFFMIAAIVGILSLLSTLVSLARIY